MKFCHAACKGSSVNQKQSLLFQKFMTENAYSQMLNVASIFVAQVLLTLTFVGKLPKHYWVFSLVKEFLKCYCFVINLPPFAFPLESTTNGKHNFGTFGFVLLRKSPKLEKYIYLLNDINKLVLPRLLIT